MDKNIINIDDNKNDIVIKSQNDEKATNDDYIQNLPEWDLVPPFTMLKRVIRK